MTRQWHSIDSTSASLADSASTRDQTPLSATSPRFSPSYATIPTVPFLCKWADCLSEFSSQDELTSHVQTAHLGLPLSTTKTEPVSTQSLAPNLASTAPSYPQPLPPWSTFAYNQTQNTFDPSLQNLLPGLDTSAQCLWNGCGSVLPTDLFSQHLRETHLKQDSAAALPTRTYLQRRLSIPTDPCSQCRTSPYRHNIISLTSTIRWRLTHLCQLLRPFLNLLLPRSTSNAVGKTAI